MNCMMSSSVFDIGATVILTSFLLDLAIGESERAPHPVILMGKVISRVEKALNRDTFSLRSRRASGAALAFVLPLSSAAVTALIIETSFLSGPVPGLVSSVFLAYTTLSARGLGDAAAGVRESLQKGDEKSAREALSRIVGRDTTELDEPGIVRGAVETVAENTSDGVIAPLFYMMIGGVPMAMAYKAINTLDSMTGYKNERYADFGLASARLDDIANYIPARLTALFMVAASFLLKMDWKGAWRVMRTDGRNHPSPNAGYPEAATAGALGIQLGGCNSYAGRIEVRPHIGDKGKVPEREDIGRAVKLMYLSSILMVGFSALLRNAIT